MGNINSAFWDELEALVHESEIVINRPKGSHHPRFPDIIYPVDYGYLKDTSSMDGGGIDVWRGSDSSDEIDAVVCTLGLHKRDSEVKILVNCTDHEKKLILEFHNNNYMKGLLIER